MPAKGKHRRPKSQRISRGFAVAGTGGAALALPLFGATGANAAVDSAAPAAAPATAPAAAKAAAKTYSVVSGDSLSAIAEKLDVDGGWKKLYKENRKVVGDDPRLILPGMKLQHPAAEQPESKPEAKAEPKSGDDSQAKAETKPEPKAGDASQAKPEAEPAPAANGFSAPVEGPISTAYRTAGAMWSSGYHTGTDFVVPTGTPIKAVSDGTVVSAGWGGSYGNEVVIRHADGQYSQYAHMNSLDVSSGQEVSGGQQIGQSGSTGNSTGPHLHFEVRTGESYGSDVDPVAYLRENGVSL